MMFYKLSITYQHKENFYDEIKNLESFIPYEFKSEEEANNIFVKITEYFDWYKNVLESKLIKLYSTLQFPWDRNKVTEYYLKNLELLDLYPQWNQKQILSYKSESQILNWKFWRKFTYNDIKFECPWNNRYNNSIKIKIIKVEND